MSAPIAPREYAMSNQKDTLTKYPSKLADLEGRFATLDRDGDGMVSQSELQQYILESEYVERERNLFRYYYARVMLC